MVAGPLLSGHHLRCPRHLHRHRLCPLRGVPVLLIGVATFRRRVTPHYQLMLTLTSLQSVDPRGLIPSQGSSGWSHAAATPNPQLGVALTQRSSPSAPGPQRTQRATARFNPLTRTANRTDTREQTPPATPRGEDGGEEDLPIPQAGTGRLRSKGFFLTYSQVGTHSIDLVEQQIISKFQDKIKSK